MMAQDIPKSVSRKVNGYVKAVLKLESARRKCDERYDRFVRPFDRKRDLLAAEVDRRMRALIGTQQAEARRILGAITLYLGIAVGLLRRPGRPLEHARP